MIIEKKIWPKHFKEIGQGKKRFEYRLADFNLKKGDILVLKEWDPERKNYTGRVLRKKVISVFHQNPFDYYKKEDLKKYGHYIIELE